MLQQTQVKTVIPYYERFLARFPDIEHLAAADLQDIIKAWEGLGYYARARNFHFAAQTVMATYGGRIPDDRSLFIQLKGVGEYIASAVLSIAFGKPLAAVDGNVKRVLARLHCIEDPVNRPASHKIFKKAACALLDTSSPGTFNQAMMELGALVCTPRDPDCAKCPINRECTAHLSGKAKDYPRRIPAKKIPEYHVAVGVVRKKGKMLITRRPPEGLLGGLWEFPGGKVKPGESARQACMREIAEETGLKIRSGPLLARVRHAYTHFKIIMDVFECRYQSGRVKLNGPESFRWIKPQEIDQYPFPGANHKFIPLLK